MPLAPSTGPASSCRPQAAQKKLFSAKLTQKGREKIPETFAGIVTRFSENNQPSKVAKVDPRVRWVNTNSEFLSFLSVFIRVHLWFTPVFGRSM
jgi:hypothetical protein